MIRNYKYIAKVLKVIDGDTVQLEIDFGFYIKYQLKGRLKGINAPEGKQTEAADFLRTQLPIGSQVYIETEKTQEKYGRWLVTIWLGIPYQVTSLNTELVSKGLAELYNP